MFKHGIVLGSGISGLMAAQVLSEKCETVTVIERDAEFDDREARVGVPHGGFAHILFDRGRRVVEDLFPGLLEKEMKNSGQGPAEMPKDFFFLGRAGFMPRIPTGVMTHTTSRPMLERKMRDRIKAVKNVKFVLGTEVCGLILDETGDSVRGVKFHLQGQRERIEQCHGDLVVCAMGRHSRLDDFLQELGVEPPLSKVIEANEDYASRVFQHTSAPKNWKAVILTPAPPVRPVGCVLFPAENNTYICALRCPRNQLPPTTDEGFWQMLKGVADGFMAEILQGARPITPVQYYRRLTNSCKFYDRVQKWPRRLVVLGENLAGLNPGFGQGMSASAAGIEIFRQALLKHKDDGQWERQLHRDQLAMVQNAWMFITFGDDIFDVSALVPTSNWRKTLQGRLKAWRADRIRDFAMGAMLDAKLETLFFQLLNMTAPVSRVFRPDYLLRAYLTKRFRKIAPSPRPVIDNGNRAQVQDPAAS